MDRDWLIRLGYIDEKDIIRVLAHELGMEYTQRIDAALERHPLLPREMAVRYCMVPLGVQDGDLRVAVANPFHEEAQAEVRQVARAQGLEVTFVLALENQILEALERMYPSGEGDE